ncbi:MAG: inositol monophosphatase [Candidatus Doudnabacteria bacterium]|nr:inositol monophosphatase [Candidatus Doudnabacteria bacterium]
MNFKNVALLAAKKAGAIVKTNYGKKLQVTVKGEAGKDFVTNADIGSEKAIITTIKKAFPDHAILAEESGAHTGTSEYTWVIDPLDGTTNFSRNIPFFSVSIALAKKEEIILGLVYNPILNELFFAEKGSQALLNNKPIFVSERKTLAKSILSQSFDYSNQKRKDNFRNIQKIFFKIEGFRLYHSTELELCNVACGRTEGYMVSSSNPWDIAAGAFIIERAGGKVTNFDGTKWSYKVPRIVATNKRIHKELLQVLDK